MGSCVFSVYSMPPLLHCDNCSEKRILSRFSRSRKAGHGARMLTTAFRHGALPTEGLRHGTARCACSLDKYSLHLMVWMHATIWVLVAPCLLRLFHVTRMH